jgi:hypothetical protein
VHQHRDDRDVTFERGRDLETNEVTWIVESALSILINGVEPILTDEREEDAARSELLVEDATKVEPLLHPRDIDKDRLFSKPIAKILEQAARLTFRVAPAIADEDSAHAFLRTLQEFAHSAQRRVPSLLQSTLQTTDQRYIQEGAEGESDGQQRMAL